MHKTINNLTLLIKEQGVFKRILKMNTIKKTLRLLVLTAIYYPLIDLMLFYSFVLRTTIGLGRFPQYNNPDPKELGFDIHYNIVMESSNYLPFSFITVCLYGIICLVLKRNILKVGIIHFYLFIGFIIWWIALIFSELSGWFVD